MSKPLPETLSAIQRHRLADAATRQTPRRFQLDMRHMTWLINGRTFQMDSVADDEVVRLGDLEVWEFANPGTTMGIAHPMHIHNVQFQVLERSVALPFRRQWESVRRGLVDEGWKDTVLVMPGQTVGILVKFEHYSGLYWYHCHNLEHEGMGMMRNFRIEV